MDYSEKALVVVPTYNEKANITALVERIEKLSHPIDLLIVDDNSPDGTGKIADALAQMRPWMHVVHRTEKDGLGRAYCTGFKWALENGYEYICEMDADFSHDPGELPNFIECAKQADLVLGTRYKDGIRVINWPLNRLILSTGAAKYVQIITGMPFTDPTGGFKCFRRKSLENIDLDAVKSNGYSFQIEMTHKVWRQGMKVVEHPIIFTERLNGSSKMSFHIIVEAIHRVWGLLLENGLRRKPKRPET